MQHLKQAVAAITFMILTSSLCAQTTVQSWVGLYAVEQAGHHGTLLLKPTEHKCAPATCTGIDASYNDEDRTAYPATVRILNQQNQHLALTVAFPTGPQPFDFFLLSEPLAEGLTASRLAGTTVTQGRIFGATATRLALTAVKKAAQPEPAAKTAIDADGQITTKNPDGSTTYRRLNVCGSKTVFPNGRVSVLSCSQVPFAIPADPPPGNTEDKWLQRQDDALISIIQSLLDPASYQNYLANYETNQAPALHQQISDRTKYITQLTQTK